MQTLQSPTVRKQTKQNTYVNTGLSSYFFVLVKHGAVKKPLWPTYDGPFKVLQRANKHFTLDICEKKKFVSLDHLKPAYVCGHITHSRCIV